MSPSRELREFIKGWEALRQKPYLDGVGVYTVGWGHVLSPDSPRRTYTLEECETFFEDDVLTTAEGVDDALKVEIPQPCFDACVSFAFNVGVGRFRGSTLLRKINDADLDGAAAEFSRWKYGTDRGTGKLIELAGLVKRRAAERQMFEYGDYSGRP